MFSRAFHPCIRCCLVFGFFLSLASLQAQSVLAPYREAFDGADLPDAPEWNFSSTGTGRIQIAEGELDATLAVAGNTTTSGINRLRGNIFQATEHRILYAFDQYLELPADETLYFRVYEADVEAGPYRLLHSSSQFSRAGNRFFSSGAMTLPIENGKYYLLGVAWQGDVGYRYQTGVTLPMDLGLGDLLSGGIEANVFPLMDSLTPGSNTLVYEQKIRSAATTFPTVPNGVEQPSSNTNTDLFRGNLYEMSSDQTLAYVEQLMNPGAGTTLTFTVHEASTETGPFTEQYRGSVEVENGQDWQRSPYIGLNLESGKFYVIGCHWDNSSAYTFTSSHFASPQNLGFAQVTKGIQGTGQRPASFSNPTNVDTAYHQRIFPFEPASALRMDSSLDDSMSVNQADLRLDLSGMSRATLAVFHESRGEEEHAGDGIFLLENSGSVPQQIFDFPNNNSVETEYSVDLIQAASLAGITLGPNMILRLGQEDNFGWASDGRQFRDLRIETPMDLQAVEVLPERAIPERILIRGTEASKSFTATLNWEQIGGLEAMPLQDATLALQLRTPSSGMLIQEQEESLENLSFPAASRVLNSRDVTVTVPASVKLPAYLYELRMVLDPADQLAEAKEGNNESSANVVVNHYSGILTFGEVEASIIITDWDARTAFSSTEHVISGFGSIQDKGFAFTDLKVDKNLTTLDYSLDSSETTEFELAALQEISANGIRYRSIGNMKLNKFGLFADLELILPSGLGWASSSDAFLLESAIHFSDVSLDSEIKPLQDLESQDTRWVCEESKPMMFEVDALTWDISEGTLELNLTGASSYVREDETSDLLANLLSGGITEEMAHKKSNEGYFRHAVVLADEKLLVEVGPEGGARCSLYMPVNAGEFRTHMPYGVQLKWEQAGSLYVEQDLVVENSKLSGLASLRIAMLEGCPSACPGEEPVARYDLEPTSEELYFTRDGGLVATGTLGELKDIRWGYRLDDEVYAHQVMKLNQASFLMSGSMLRGDQWEGFSNADAIGVLLNSAVDWNDPLVMERSGSLAYRTGEGVYPGLNVRVQDHPSLKGQSLLGGELFDGYFLSNRSKFYMRFSGLSGIQEVGGFSKTANIYGYDFEFTHFGFNYLSSINQDSRTAGSLSVPYPSQLLLPFGELTISCKGDLEAAVPRDPDEPHVLEYWQAPLDVFAIHFERDEAACAGSSGFLTLQVKSEAELIPEPLFARIGISGGEGGLPEAGNLIRPADGLLDIHSRFSVPATIQIQGPGTERYTLTPVHEMYLNHYEDALGLHDAIGEGFFSLAGDLDVPFFPDMQVQIHTGAGEEKSVLHLMGGWPTFGWKDGGDRSFFTHQIFDGDHRGYDQAVSLKQYRSNDLEQYQPRAKRNWLNIIPLEYPLRWNSVTRSFRSPQTERDSILVADMDHQVDFLSPEHVELSFGAQIEGFPRINLETVLTNELDETHGILGAILTAGLADEFEQIDLGKSSIEKHLNSLTHEALNPALDELLRPLANSLYLQLRMAYRDGEDYYTQPLEQGLVGNGPASVFTEEMTHFIQGKHPGEGYAADLIQNLRDTSLALAVLNRSYVPDPALPDVRIPGLLHRNEEGEYDVLGGFTLAMLEHFADEGDFNLPGTPLDEVDAFLKEFEGALEAVSALLTEVQGQVDEQIDLLDSSTPGTGFRFELIAAVDPDLIESLVPKIQQRIAERLRSFPEGRNPFDDVSEEEFQLWLLQDMKREILGSRFSSDIVTVVRSRLYDIEGRFYSAADGLFQVANDVSKEALRNVFKLLVGDFDGMLGELGGVMGTSNIDGYAHIRGDDLHQLRLDGDFQWKVPDDLEFKGFMEIVTLKTEGPAGCSFSSGEAHRVTLGATELPCSWLGSDLRVNVQADFSFHNDQLAGLGGSFGFDSSGDGIDFEGFKVTQLDAGVAFGSLENYIAAACRAEFSGAEVAGGIFFGRTCSLDPLKMVDQDVGSVVSEVPFTGGYVYGEGWVPFSDGGCAFNFAVGLGAGLFFFADGPTYGAKILMGAKGEALCVVTIRGEVKMLLAKTVNGFRGNADLILSGKAGSCPFCVKFKATIGVLFELGFLYAE